jgi:hypothetical protein
MAPREVGVVRASGVLDEKDAETNDGGLKEPEKRIAKPRTFELQWRNIILMSLLHLNALYGVYLMITGQLMWKTLVFGKIAI